MALLEVVKPEKPQDQVLLVSESPKVKVLVQSAFLPMLASVGVKVVQTNAANTPKEFSASTKQMVRGFLMREPTETEVEVPMKDQTVIGEEYKIVASVGGPAGMRTLSEQEIGNIKIVQIKAVPIEPGLVLPTEGLVAGMTII